MTEHGIWQETLCTIYEAGASHDGWGRVVDKLADCCGLGVGSLVFVDPDLQVAPVNAPRADPEVIEAYNRHWWALDPSIGNTRNLPVGEVHVMNARQRRAFLRSKYYGEYWRYSGMGAERICTNLFTYGNDAFANLTLLANRSNDTISNDARKRFTQLVPHLVRAIGITRDQETLALERLTAKGRLREQALFAIAVDRIGRPVTINEEAEHALNTFSFLRLRHGVLTLSDRKAADQLARLIEQCGQPFDKPPGGVISPSPNDIPPGAVIKVIPWKGGERRSDFGLPAPPVAMVMIKLSAPARGFRQISSQALQERYGLTPAETRIALEITKGGGRDALAERLGISVATVRTHLNRIFEKTGIRRQSELVALVLSQPRGPG